VRALTFVDSIRKKEENLFAKKTGCQKGLQPINAGHHVHVDEGCDGCF